MRVRRPIGNRLRAFFCTPGDARNLAVFRIVVFALILINLCRIDFSRYTQMPEVLRVAPAGYAPWFHLIPWNLGFVRLVQFVAVVASLAASLGYTFRVTAVIACVGALYLLGLPEMFGKIDHVHHHLIWFAALLAASRASDALSIDAAAARARAATGAMVRQSSRAYSVPLRCAWLLIGVIYFFPGVAKLAAGPEWIFSDNLKHLMHGFWDARGFLPAVRIDRYPIAYKTAAAATIAFEIGFLPALFFPRLRAIAVLGGLVFHLLSWVYLRILFLDLMLCYVVFVDWAALIDRCRPPLANAARAVVTHSALAPAVVGGLLLSANILCGVLRIDSWPFAVFPRFNGIAAPTRRSLEVVVRDAAGGTRSVNPRLRPEALLVLLRGEEQERRVRLRALQDYLLRNEVHLVHGETLQVFEVTRSTAPEDRGAEPRKRTLLAEAAAP